MRVWARGHPALQKLAPLSSINPLCTFIPVSYPPVHVYKIDAILEAIEDTSEETFLFAHDTTSIENSHDYPNSSE
jgi:hypothetical protein